MGGRAVAGNLNLGRWLVWAGIAGLLVSFWVPWAVAQRTARTEDRADRLALLLLRTASSLQPLRGEPFELALLQARLQWLAVGSDVFADDFECVDETPPPGVLATFVNKHYVFQLACSPPPDPRQQRADSPLPPPLEVTAWPRDAAGPAHAAFFCSEIAEPVFTRNLTMGYIGLAADARPLPGSSYRRDSDAHGGQTRAYRDGNDERWLLRPQPGEPTPREADK